MKLFRPDVYVVSVLDIDPAQLAAKGVKAVLLDVDNTLMPRCREEVPQNIACWVEELKAQGIAVLILSNSFKDRVFNAANQLGLDLVGKAMKPLRKGYAQCCRKLGLAPGEVLMVGDQTYTDILGAHLYGMKAVLVTPLSQVDLKHTKALRKVERLLLLGMKPQGGPPAFVDTEEDLRSHA